MAHAKVWEVQQNANQRSPIHQSQPHQLRSPIIAKSHLLPTPHNFATFALDVEIARARKRLAKLVMMMEAIGVWHRMIACGDPWSNALMAHAKVWEVQQTAKQRSHIHQSQPHQLRSPIIAKSHLLPTPHNFATFALDVEIARAHKRLAKLVMMMEAIGVWHRMITCGDP